LETQIKTQPLKLEVYGFSGAASNKQYAAKAFELMDKMWKLVKGNQLKNKGKNIWVYDANDMVFAGVEMEDGENSNGLEKKSIQLTRYAYFKHIGPYQLIQQSGQKMNSELIEKGFRTDSPYIEIYGHWSADESKLETELIVNLK
jgi:predicted transcriptional regulator YdeE